MYFLRRAQFDFCLSVINTDSFIFPVQSINLKSVKKAGSFWEQKWWNKVSKSNRFLLVGETVEPIDFSGVYRQINGVSFSAHKPISYI